MSGRLPWALWWTQTLAILRLEMRKNFAGKRAIPVYLLAAAPVLLFGAHAVLSPNCQRCDPGRTGIVYAGVFQLFVLRLAIFFGCVAIFMNLFRGEVLEKSLHYYFLAPVRREVLVVGKYLSGLVTTVLLFGLGTLLSYLILCAHLASVKNTELLAGPALSHLGAYLGVTALACLGYGAVFLVMGLFFRNPIIPAVAVLIWESITVFLPPLLKKISVIFYLESLCPVEIPYHGGSAIFAISADPTPAWIAIPGLLGLTVLVILLASLRIRRTEINYGAE